MGKIGEIEEMLKKASCNNGDVWATDEGVVVSWASSHQEWGEEFTAGIGYFFTEDIPCQCFATIGEAVEFLAEKAEQLKKDGWSIEPSSKAGELIASR